MIFFDDQLTDPWCLRDALPFLSLQGLAPLKSQTGEDNNISFIPDVIAQNELL